MRAYRIILVGLGLVVGCEGGCEKLKEARVLCARQGDVIGPDQHALCSDSSMCNGIEWCDPTHPLRDERNCVTTQPCDTRALRAALGLERGNMCFEPSGEYAIDGLYGAPFRTCRVEGCAEEACYDADQGLILNGARWVPPLASDGLVEHDGFSYEIACLRSVCVDALCRDDDDCETDFSDCNGEEVCEPRIGCVHAGDPCAELEPKSDDGEWVCIEGRSDLCEWQCMDADGDGFGRISCGGTDCDDDDADRYPGNVEICDPDHDEDCDPDTIGDLDTDGDGYIDMNCGNVVGESEKFGADCDDQDPQLSPAQNEICNAVDDDCDGAVDEEVGQMMYVDNDGDGFGQPDSGIVTCPGPGLSYVAGDCDDDNPQILPGAIFCTEPDNVQITEYRLCQADGTYAINKCASACYQQPGGTGVCL